jgi:hypothetical protein
MKLTLNPVEINNILLAWAQKHFPQGDFNTVSLETYTYAPNATFTYVEETPDEAL